MKTFRRVVRRRLEAALQLRVRSSSDGGALFRAEVDPLREDIPLEVIALDGPSGKGELVVSESRTRRGRGS